MWRLAPAEAVADDGPVGTEAGLVETDGGLVETDGGLVETDGGLDGGPVEVDKDRVEGLLQE